MASDNLQECVSPPLFQIANNKTNSIAIFHTLNRNFIHILIQDSYNLIDNSNTHTVKCNNENISSFENGIKLLNKELCAFGKSIAQEQKKINWRSRLQGNKRKYKEKALRSKLKKKKQDQPEMIYEINNAMFSIF